MPESGKRKVLVVEDAEATWTVQERSLVGSGYEPTICTNGSAALKAIAAEDFDLVVLDLALPEVDGWAVLGRLRAEPRTASVPVLIVTARERCRNATEGPSGRSDRLPHQAIRRGQVPPGGERSGRGRLTLSASGSALFEATHLPHLRRGRTCVVGCASCRVAPLYPCGPVAAFSPLPLAGGG